MQELRDLLGSPVTVSVSGSVTQDASERAFASSSLETLPSPVNLHYPSTPAAVRIIRVAGVRVTEHKCLFMPDIAQVLGKVLVGYLLCRGTRLVSTRLESSQVECIRPRGIEMY